MLCIRAKRMRGDQQAETRLKRSPKHGFLPEGGGEAQGENPGDRFKQGAEQLFRQLFHFRIGRNPDKACHILHAEGERHQQQANAHAKGEFPDGGLDDAQAGEGFTDFSAGKAIPLRSDRSAAWRCPGSTNRKWRTGSSDPPMAARFSKPIPRIVSSSKTISVDMDRATVYRVFRIDGDEPGRPAASSRDEK